MFLESHNSDGLSQTLIRKLVTRQCHAFSSHDALKIRSDVVIISLAEAPSSPFFRQAVTSTFTASGGKRSSNAPMT